MAFVDFRSDFVARPTPEMVKAMVGAAQHQPDFGLREDRYVAALEAEAANLLDTEDALFCPTCTQANQIAIHLHCRPGESVVAESLSHIFTSESGALGSLTGALAVGVPGRNGVMDSDAFVKSIRAGDPARSRTALVVVENTHVYSGGRVVPIEAMQKLRDIARSHGIAVHLDGARLFNAAIALGRPVRELARCADSVAVSLNKGLAAPMGAILAGSRDFIREATRVRHMFGGGWRPAHMLAAAASVALRTMIDRLSDDHANAKRLAEGLKGWRGLSVDFQQVQSNIVLLHVDPAVIATDTLVQNLRAHDILVMPIAVGSASILRFVTHHDINAADIERTVSAVKAIL